MRTRTFNKALAGFLTIALLAPAGLWLFVKLKLSAETSVYHRVWSESGACHIDAYIPNYASLGIPGRLIELFSSSAFFRVYRDDGKLLKSSEWLVWQREFAEDESAKWIHGHALYPATNGYEGWTLPECN
ncbi:hypothetical protein RTE98_04180 [Stutzerimonas frequens]|uniref:hypothetical protein n=1 Tax=Stutzerimonas frequens TaxID=2968969 RepID=UPI0029345D18|nr:hypothetical protein [Stutzerimonas frequens]WOC79732.1 hypothetical protein RTE98_04180 [Stutzerimonas frequens]